MEKSLYIDRKTGLKKIELIYKPFALESLYGDSFWSLLLQKTLLPLITTFSFFSHFYGLLQKTALSKRKILPFIETFEIDKNEFLDPVESYSSFNAFFIRRLKAASRPIHGGREEAIIPADGRYYFYPQIDQCDGFIVKGKFFSLSELLNSMELAEEYKEGSLVIARLAPCDYHRFHFPCEGLAGPSKLINGFYYSVNPIAVKKNLKIFSENKRSLCILESPSFGSILYLAVGATNVATIQETYQPNRHQEKGEERGYFEFGGSALILLFKKGKIAFEADLLEASKEGFEIRCLMGEKMGRAPE